MNKEVIEKYKKHPDVIEVVDSIVTKMEDVYNRNFEAFNKKRAILGLPLFKDVQEFHNWLFKLQI